MSLFSHALPWNIRGSASQLFFQDKQSPHYAALLAISDLPHPDRSILSAFINDAADPDEAARYFLCVTSLHGDSGESPEDTISDFLSKWKTLIDKFRPTQAKSLPEATKTVVYKRDGGFAVCICRSGAIYFTVMTWADHPDPSLKQSYYARRNDFTPMHNNLLAVADESVLLENRDPERAPILSEELLALHARLSKSLAWMEATKYIGTKFDGTDESVTWLPRSLKSQVFRLLRRVWVALPCFVRSRVYDRLIGIGLRLYGRSLSMTVYRLPFGLYLRRGSPTLAAKYQVEAHTLCMVEQLTSIPAPRAVDVLDTPRFSYLLMTLVPGRPIGHMMYTMTDEQVKQAVIDLKGYVSELRQIPNRSATGFQICNSAGGGILDWRIPDNQREELRFETEADFNKYLTDPFWDDIRKRAAVSHDVRHEIVFTHGDLNPRNILAENGKITGVVDWENAGWFPEYWEFTKAHYSVRSVIRWLADVVDRVFEGYRDELHVENMLSDLLGPF